MPKKKKAAPRHTVSQRSNQRTNVQVVVNSGSRRKSSGQRSGPPRPPAARPPGPILQPIVIPHQNTTDNASLLILRHLLQERSNPAPQAVQPAQVLPPAPSAPAMNPVYPQVPIIPPVLPPPSPKPYAQAVSSRDSMSSLLSPRYTRTMHQAQDQFEQIRAGLNKHDRPIDLSDITNRLGGMTSRGLTLTPEEEKGEAINYQKYLDVLSPFLGSSQAGRYSAATKEIKKRFPDDDFAQSLNWQKLKAIHDRQQKK